MVFLYNVVPNLKPQQLSPPYDDDDEGSMSSINGSPVKQEVSSHRKLRSLTRTNKLFLISLGCTLKKN
jgi:hypothetical protein